MLRPFAQQRAYSRLLNCRAAYRQATQGARLDAAHPVAPPVGVLEDIFDDATLFDDANPMYLPRKHAAATPATPWAARASDVKGVHAPVVSSMFNRGTLGRCGTKQSFGALGVAFYFPPWHAAAQGRKSRPALLTMRRQGEQYNGSAAAQRAARAARPASTRAATTMNPLDFAVWRLRTARRYRRALFEHALKDGLYVMLAKSVPTQQQALDVMRQFAERVARADLAWAAGPSGLSIDFWNQELARDHLRPLAAHTDPADWQLDRPARQPPS